MFNQPDPTDGLGNHAVQRFEPFAKIIDFQRFYQGDPKSEGVDWKGGVERSWRHPRVELCRVGTIEPGAVTGCRAPRHDAPRS